MKLKNYLAEKFSFSFKKFGHYIEVFSNPTKKDYENIKNVLKSSESLARFIARYDKKEFLVWDSYLATHEQVYSYLGLKLLDWSSGYFIHGEFNIKKYPPKLSKVNGEVDFFPEIYSKYKNPPDYITTCIKLDWSWIYKYSPDFKPTFDKGRKFYL